MALANGEIDIHDVPPSPSPLMIDDDSEQLYLLKAVGFSMSDSLRSTLRDMHIDIGPYVPYNSRIIRCTHAQRTALSSRHDVRWIGLYDARYKLNRQLNNAMERHMGDDAPTLIVIMSHSGMCDDLKSKMPELRCAEVTRTKALVQFPETSLISDDYFKSMLNAITKRSDVLYIEPRQTFKANNYYARSLVQSGRPVDNDEITPFYDMGIDGRGQIIAIADTGVDINHCFFFDKDHPGTLL